MSKAVLFVLMCGFVEGACSREMQATRKLVETNAVTLQITSAGDFLIEMRDQGRLPGISKDEHGKITSEALPFAGRTEYPISITFRLTKNDGPFIYHYSVVRHSEQDRWQLKRAWRSDSDGRTVE